MRFKTYVWSLLVNHRAAGRTAETVPAEFLKAESRILAFGRGSRGNKQSVTGNVLQQSARLALKKLSVPRKNTQGTRLFLQGSNLSGKPAKIVQCTAHVLSATLRLER